MQRFVRFDGGQVGVAGDRHLAVAWYTRHLGLTEEWDSPAEGQTVLTFPVRNALPLVAVMGGDAVDCWGADTIMQRAANVRLVLGAPDLAATRAALLAGGVEVSAVLRGPDGAEFFEFADLEGTRLTVAPKPAGSEYPAGTLFNGYAATRIGVSDLARSVAWYERHLNMIVLEQSAAAAQMRLGAESICWLETLPADYFSGDVDQFARPYILAETIDEAQEYCASAGLRPSPVVGSPTALRFFHCFDPDGNQVNVWSYPEAQ